MGSSAAQPESRLRNLKYAPPPQKKKIKKIKSKNNQVILSGKICKIEMLTIINFENFNR
jgi:hypothetical protein